VPRLASRAADRVPECGGHRLAVAKTQTGSARTGQTTGVSLLVSGAAHGAVLAVLLVMATASAPSAGVEPPPDPPSDLVQLVFVAERGRGGGVGIGQGTGHGVGAGNGGGTGGGPYRPGSGIEPPGLLRKVAPDYTDPARRAGLEGEVLLETVVTAEGTVTDVRVLQRLGSGLDERASAAVQQWQFSPARRHGVPVAVLVEVAVAFRLR